MNLGAGYYADRAELVGIFDLDKTTEEKITRDFLAKAEKAGQVVAAGNELPKSFLVCAGAGKQTVYLSRFAPATLTKRAETDDGFSG